jgi:hypothetical protein
MFVPDPKGTQRMGLRDARYVIFNGGQQLLWATAFETDWDSYIDDALLIIGIEHFLDWMQHTVEGDKVVEWAASVGGFEKFDKNDPALGKTDWGALPQHFIQKIVELRRLLYRHTTTFLNPEIIIQGAKHFCMQGDSTFLEEKLEYLRSVDVITHHVEQAGQDNVVV